MVCAPLTYKKNNSKDCDKRDNSNNNGNNNITTNYILLVFRTLLNVNLVQRRYKKSKVRKTFVLANQKQQARTFTVSDLFQEICMLIKFKKTDILNEVAVPQ